MAINSDKGGHFLLCFYPFRTIDRTLLGLPRVAEGRARVAPKNHSLIQASATAHTFCLEKPSYKVKLKCLNKAISFKI